MEIGLRPGMNTYSGGLGMLAGDLIRSAADTGLPMVAVTLIHRKGYFHQSLTSEGDQVEEDEGWPIESYLQEESERVSVRIEGRDVHIRAWRYQARGVTGKEVPVLLLDTNLPENTEWDRSLTDHLYGHDDYYRLCQEIVLGTGGVRMLWALGYQGIARYHMNEGHAAFLGLELLDEATARPGRQRFAHEDIEAVRQKCVFTTHTPVPVGHDQFSMELVSRVLGREDLFVQNEVFCCEGVLNMTYLALNLSHYVNGVAKEHRKTSRRILTPRRPELHYEIDSITNGVHPATWAADSFSNLFDEYIPSWREDAFSLRNALSIPPGAIWNAHEAAKNRLLEHVRDETGRSLDPDSLTIGFARRATAYKRSDLIFEDIDRLKALAEDSQPLQLIFAGKAHPADRDGKAMIRRVFEARAHLEPEIQIVYLANYDMELARLLVSGCDVWLNTPELPLEASGTSGMKAAINGVPSLSILDGWWIEGCIEGVTGWAIGARPEEMHDARSRRSADAASLYEKLRECVIPIFYDNPGRFLEMMRHAIALNGSFFNSERMLQEYISKAYFR